MPSYTCDRCQQTMAQVSISDLLNGETSFLCLPCAVETMAEAGEALLASMPPEAAAEPAEHQTELAGEGFEYAEPDPQPKSRRAAKAKSEESEQESAEETSPADVNG